MNAPPKCEDLYLKIAELERRESDLMEKIARAGRVSFSFFEERDALQQRLTFAERREADLKKLLCDVINDAATGFAALKVDLANRVNDALKPAAEGEGS